MARAAAPRAARTRRCSRARRSSHYRSRRQRARRTDCHPDHVERTARRSPSSLPTAIHPPDRSVARPYQTRAPWPMCSFGDNVCIEHPRAILWCRFRSTDTMIGSASRPSPESICEQKFVTDHCVGSSRPLPLPPPSLSQTLTPVPAPAGIGLRGCLPGADAGTTSGAGALIAVANSRGGTPSSYRSAAGFLPSLDASVST